MLSLVYRLRHELDSGPARHHRRHLPYLSPSNGSVARRRRNHAEAGVDLVDPRRADADEHGDHLRRRPPVERRVDVRAQHGRRSCCLPPPARFSCKAKRRRAMSWRRSTGNCWAHARCLPRAAGSRSGCASRATGRDESSGGAAPHLPRLHDTLGHHLTALSLQLDVAARLSEEPAADHIRQAHAITRLLLGDVRDVVSRLRETRQLDLAQAIRWRSVGHDEGLAIHLDLPDALSVDDLHAQRFCFAASRRSSRTPPGTHTRATSGFDWRRGQTASRCMRETTAGARMSWCSATA